MMTMMRDAVTTVFKEPRNRVLFTVASVGVFVLLYMVPVWTTPGNTIAFHFSILPTWVLVVMILLAVLNGLLITMQWYIHQETKKQHLHETVKQSATLFGTVVSALAATVACAACYSSLLALFGLGAATFVAKYQAYIAVGALFLTVIALYYNAKKIDNKCRACQIG